METETWSKGYRDNQNGGDQCVKQILDEFVVSAVSGQNCAAKCAKSQVLFLPTASQSFFRP